MLRFIKICILAGLLPCFVQAQQTSIDSLKNILSTQKKQERLATLKEITQFYKVVDLDSLEHYATLGLQVATQEKDSAAIASFLYYKGIVASSKYNIDSVSKYVVPITKIATQTKNDRLLSAAHLLLGQSYQQEGKLEKATEYFMEAMRLGDKNEDYETIGGAAISIGNIHSNQNNYSKSVFFLQMAENAFTKINNQEGLIAVCINIGNIYFYETKYDSAIYYYEKALKAPSIQANYYAAGLIYHNLSAIYKYKGDYKTAIKNAKIALTFREKTENMHVLAENYNILAEIYMNLGKQDSAKYLLTKALHVQPKEPTRILSNTYKLLAQSDSLGKNFEAALHWFSLYNVCREQVVKEENLQSIKEISTKYEVEKKEQENDLLKKENIIVEQKYKIEQWVKYGVSIVAILLLVLFLLSRRLALSRKEKLKQQENIFKLEQERSKHQEAVLLYQNELQTAENKLLQNEVENTQRELVSKMLQISDNKQKLIEWQKELKIATEDENILKNIEKIIHKLEKQIRNDDSWDKLVVHFNKVFPNFFVSLREKHSNLTKTEERLCAYVRMQLTHQETADILGIDIQSLFRKRQRLKEKFNLENAKDIENYLANF